MKPQPYCIYDATRMWLLLALTLVFLGPRVSAVVNLCPPLHDKESTSYSHVAKVSGRLVKSRKLVFSSSYFWGCRTIYIYYIEFLDVGRASNNTCGAVEGGGRAVCASTRAVQDCNRLPAPCWDTGSETASALPSYVSDIPELGVYYYVFIPRDFHRFTIKSLGQFHHTAKLTRTMLGENILLRWPAWPTWRRRTGIKSGGRRRKGWRCKWWRQERGCLGRSIQIRWPAYTISHLRWSAKVIMTGLFYWKMLTVTVTETSVWSSASIHNIIAWSSE